MSSLLSEANGVSHVSETVQVEIRHLRRTMRDLVALSTLPAVWSGLDSPGIARSLCDVLLGMLALDLLYVRLGSENGAGTVEATRGKRDASVDDAIKAKLISLVSDERWDAPRTFANPCGSGSFRAAIVRFGAGNNGGVLAACSAREDFPTEQDRLLLSVAANQAAIVIERHRAEQRTREQQEWLRVTLASIADAVIATDTDGKVTFLNSVAQERIGRLPNGVIGQPMSQVFPLIHEGTREPVANLVDEVMRADGGISHTDCALFIAKDGTELPVDSSTAPIRDANGRIIGIVCVFRAVQEQRRREKFRSVRLGVTQVLNQSVVAREAIEGALRVVCEELEWEIGLFWSTAENGVRLRCCACWHRGDPALQRLVSASCEQEMEIGDGLPGHAWLSKKPVWISNLSRDRNFPRLVTLVDLRLQSAFACPVIIGDKVLGVIEFFTRSARAPDADLLEMMNTLAGHLAQFIERKNAEEELRRSEEELAEFFENATIGLHWVDSNGKILRANRAELDMLGYEREDYIGRPISEFHVDQHVICDILRRLSAGEQLSEYPARLRCKDGSIKHVLIDSSVRWEGDKFIHTRCFTRDITERRRVQMELADAKARLDAALAAGAIMTWTWDIPNNRLYADERLAQLFNLPASESEGGLLDRYIKAIHPDDVERTLATLSHSVESGEEYQATYRLIRSDGSVRWVTARGVVEHDSDGKPCRMPGVLIDITEQKSLEEELRVRAEKLSEADRRKDEFLATLAHELRNPLAPLRNSLEILKMPHVGAAMIQQTRAMMARQVDQLVRLVDDLMDVSRVMRGKIDLRKEPLELATIVARAVETVQPLIEVQGHRLDITLPQESLLVEVDSVRMSQVIGNLLTNAAKYTEANGRIWVSAKQEGGQVVLSVRDSGLGIAPELLPHIFELFVQADHTSTRAQGGLGIGLTLARNLVQMHGGAIEAHSGGLGKGSEFVVRLPLALQPSREGHVEQLDEVEVRDSGKRGQRILVVDDNHDAAMSLATLLQLQGHTLHVANDGPSGLAAFESHRPQVVILDLGMPGMDGYEVARRIRDHSGTGSVVIAALTGWGQEADRRRTAAAGFDYHLVKPLDLTSLTRVLDRL